MSGLSDAFWRDLESLGLEAKRLGIGGEWAGMLADRTPKAAWDVAIACGKLMSKSNPSGKKWRDLSLACGLSFRAYLALDPRGAYTHALTEHLIDQLIEKELGIKRSIQ